MLDALASHYGETIREILGGWSWKLFCARWRRVVEYMEAERGRRRERESQETFDRLARETAQEHARHGQYGYAG